MKKIFYGVFILFIQAVFTGGGLQAQDDVYKFTDKYTVKTTGIKNQYSSGTCWSYSGLSFFESEAYRVKGKDFDLAEMFIVSNAYIDKADMYVRMHGKLNFSEGGAFHDVAYVMKKYGIVPEEAYKGLCYGTKNHVHQEMAEILTKYVEGVVANKNGTLSTSWRKAYKGVVEAYLGAIPSEFDYNGKKVNPKDFVKNELGLNMDDYVEIGSFTHHPFYEKFAIEVPDNWMMDQIYNVPLNELEAIMDNALKNGYSVAWGADISHPGFKNYFGPKGLAIVPALSADNMPAGLEQAKWDDMSKDEKEAALKSSEKIVKEMEITQEYRQQEFDNYTTQDDHGMHIVAIAEDQEGNKYYKVKNSWDEIGKFKGYFYASDNFIRLQTMDIMVHKDAIPKDIRKKLGL